MLTDIPKFLGSRLTHKSTKALRRLHRNVLRKLEMQRIQCEQIARRLEKEQAYLATLRRKRLRNRMRQLRRLRKRRALLIKKRQLKTKEDEEIIDQQRRAREVRMKRVKKYKENGRKRRLRHLPRRRKFRQLEDQNELEETEAEEENSRTDISKGTRRAQYMRALRRRRRLRQDDKEYQRALKLHDKRRQQQREKQRRWKLQKLEHKENRKLIQKIKKRKQLRLGQKGAKSRIKRKGLKKKKGTKKFARKGRRKIRKRKGVKVNTIPKKRRVKRTQKGRKIKKNKRKTKSEADESKKKGKKLNKIRRKSQGRRRRVPKPKLNKNEIDKEDEAIKTKSKPKSRLKRVRRKSKKRVSHKKRLSKIEEHQEKKKRKARKVKTIKKKRTRRSTKEGGGDNVELAEDKLSLRKKHVRIKPKHKPKAILKKLKEVLQSKLRKKEIGKQAKEMKEMEKQAKNKAKSKLRHTLKWEEMRRKAKEADEKRKELQERISAQKQVGKPKIFSKEQTVINRQPPQTSRRRTNPEEVKHSLEVQQQPNTRLDVEVKPKDKEEDEEKEDDVAKSLKHIKEAEERLSELETRKKRSRSSVNSILRRRRESIKLIQPSSDEKRIPGVAMSRGEILRKTRDSVFEHDLMVKKEKDGEGEYKLDEFIAFKPNKKMPEIRESYRNAALQEILKKKDESPKKFKDLAMKREEALRETEESLIQQEENEQTIEETAEAIETKQKARMSDLKRELMAAELDWKLDSEWEMIVKTEQEQNQNKPSFSETSSIRGKTSDIKIKLKELQKKEEKSNRMRKQLNERTIRAGKESDTMKSETKAKISKANLKTPSKERGQKNDNASITPKPQSKPLYSSSSKQSKIIRREIHKSIAPKPFPSTFLKGVLKFRSSAMTPTISSKMKTSKRPAEDPRSSGFQKSDGFRKPSSKTKKKDYYGYFRQSIVEQTPLTKFRSVGVKLRILRRMYRKLKKEKKEEQPSHWNRVSDPVRLARLTGYSVIDEEKFPPYSVQMDAIPSNFARPDTTTPERRLSLDRWKSGNRAGSNMFAMQGTDDGMSNWD